MALTRGSGCSARSCVHHLTGVLDVCRSALRRRLQHADEDDREDSQDIEEVIIGKDSGAEDTFAEVVGGSEHLLDVTLITGAVFTLKTELKQLLITSSCI